LLKVSYNLGRREYDGSLRVFCILKIWSLQIRLSSLVEKLVYLSGYLTQNHVKKKCFLATEKCHEVFAQISTLNVQCWTVDRNVRHVLGNASAFLRESYVDFQIQI
jgi:hypothetical protein